MGSQEPVTALRPLLIPAGLGAQDKEKHQLRGMASNPELRAAQGPHPVQFPCHPSPTSRGLWAQPGTPRLKRGWTWSPCCPHLSTIISRGTIGSPGTCRAGGALHAAFTGETSLALEEKNGGHDGCSRDRHLGGQLGRSSKELYLLLLQRGRGHQGRQEHPEGEGGTESEPTPPWPAPLESILVLLGAGPWGLSSETNPF